MDSRDWVTISFSRNEALLSDSGLAWTCVSIGFLLLATNVADAMDDDAAAAAEAEADTASGACGDERLSVAMGDTSGTE